VTHETADQRKDRINSARRESAEISQQIGIEVTSLLVRPVARQAWHDLRKQLRDGEDQYPQLLPRCSGKESDYSDYAAPPTDGKAKMMCAGCPFFEACDKFASTEKPPTGVYGGKVYGRDSHYDLED
jgi:hypothetical protein